MGKPIQSVSFNQLGGMRTDKPVTAFDEFEAVMALNCRLDEPGQAARRQGSIKYNDDRLANNGTVLGLYDFKFGSTGERFLVCEDDKIYTDTGTVRAQIYSGQTADNYYDFNTFDDFCWINNGVDRYLKYDGTTVTNGSITEPNIGSFSAATGAAGALTGTYLYLVTFYVTSTGQESNPFILSSAPSVITSSDKVDLTYIPVSSDTQVDARRIYRTTSGGSVYDAQFVTQINNNSTTTYTDNLADISLGGLVPIDHDTAPVFKKIIIHKNRGFGFVKDESALYFSKEFNLWYWPQAQIDLSATADDYRILIDPDDGDSIQNIVDYYDYVLIFKKNSVYILGGYDETDFFIRKVQYSDRVGCISFRGAIVANNWCYFIDRNGIYRTNAQSVEYVGEPVEAYFDPNNPSSDLKVNSLYLPNAVVVSDRKKPRSLIRFSVPVTGDTTNTVNLICNFESNLWSVDTGYTAQSYAIKDINNTDYLIRGDDYGFIWTEESQDGDGGLIYSTATSGTTTELVDITQSWTVNLYQGTYIDILSGTSDGDRVRILSNTSDTITIDGFFSLAPDATSVYTIGGIDYNYQHKWDDYGNSAMTKRLKYVRTRTDGSGDFNATAYIWYDFFQEPLIETVLDIDANTLWDIALWDTAVWDSTFVGQDLIRTLPNRIHNWSSVGVKHKPAGQSITFKGYDKLFQVKGFGIR